MSALVRTLAAAPLALAVTLLTAAPAQASAIYTYTGNNFTLFSASGPTTPPDAYTTADRVTVVMALAAPLAANLGSPTNLTSLTPLSFTFTDGVNTLTNANASSSRFYVATDGGGNISSWLMRSQIFAPQNGGIYQYIETSNYVLNFGPVAGPVVTDYAESTLCGPASTTGCEYFGDPHYSISGRNRNSTGTWALQTTPPPPVPEPTSMALIGVALAGLAARRRAR